VKTPEEIRSAFDMRYPNVQMTGTITGVLLYPWRWLLARARIWRCKHRHGGNRAPAGRFIPVLVKREPLATCSEAATIHSPYLTYEAEQQSVKAIRSLPWYMFLVPALFTLFMLLFNPSVLTDMRPQYTWWDFMWMVARVASSFGFCDNCFGMRCSAG